MFELKRAHQKMQCPSVPIDLNTDFGKQKAIVPNETIVPQKWIYEQRVRIIDAILQVRPESRCVCCCHGLIEEVVVSIDVELVVAW